jgi:hypothetical protein
MHVFIDTNILLNFFHYTKDELDALNDVFGEHQHGSATVHLTEQVCDEFKRNREGKIKDALKKFEGISFSPQFPHFMKAYEEYSMIRKLTAELDKLRKTTLEKVENDVIEHKLLADRLIGDIFKTSQAVPVTKDIYEKATMRMDLGNPPGKAKSLGDAVNWITLLEVVPDKEDLHVISEDGDFFSVLDERKVHPFLQEEWKRKKQGNLFAYRTLSAFMSEHFDGIAFSFDKDKEALIDSLAETGSFAGTHQVIGKLEGYGYFSLKEVLRILEAGTTNNQFGPIATDTDVSDFLNRIAVPHLARITSDQHKAILQRVIDEQRVREVV